MSNAIIYIVNGDVDEVSAIVDPVKTDNRFLSDSANVTEWDWFPEGDGQLTARFVVAEENAVAIEDLSLLSQEYPSIFIAIETVESGGIETVVSEGRVEEIV